MSQRIAAIVLDATVLSNFASTDSIDWLVTSFNALKTVPAVEKELRSGYSQGYTFLEPAIKAIEAEDIPTFLGPAAYETALEEHPFLQQLDSGEAQALFAATSNNSAVIRESLDC